MRILIAPNAFKNSLDATKVAEAIAKGLKSSKVSCDIDIFPVADGGDGTGSLILHHLKGKKVETIVQDPIGRKMNAPLGLVENDKTAIIELADASGLRLLNENEYDPLHANTYGTGELILKALDLGVSKIILGIGGSATVDAATGMLQALGVQFLDPQGNKLQHVPESLLKLSRIDLSQIDKRLEHTEMIVLCDVDVPLLGPSGASFVFGPQKGADQKTVDILENALSNMNLIVRKQMGKEMSTIKYGGAAGGTAAGMNVFLNAELINGIDYFLEITGFEKKLQQADIVITGEGSIDEQTLQGKAAFGVAKKAKEKSIPVIAVAGTVPLIKDERFEKYFDAILPINHTVMDIQTAISHTYENLVRTGNLLGQLLDK